MQNRLPYLLGLIVLMIAGSLLRIGPAMNSPMWFDEADTWRSGIIDPVTSGWSQETGLYEPVAMDYGKFFRWENHFETAPLTFLFARISTDILGSTEPWAMRLPSLIAGILCIPAAFWLGSIVRGSAVGIVAAALVTFDPSQVDQSHQCRMYTVMMLLMLLAAALTIKLMRPSTNEQSDTASLPSQPSRTRWPLWALLGVVLGLLLCTTQFNIAVWVGIAMGGVALLVFGLITKQPHPQMKQVALGMTFAYVVGLLVANIGVYRIIHRIQHGGVGDRPNLSYGEMTREIIVAAKDLIDLTPAGLIVYVFAAIGFALLFKRCKTSTAILLGIVAANILMLFKFLRIHHFMDPRYLSCIQPALYIGLAMFAVGFANVMLRRAALSIIILFIAVQAWQATHLIDYYQQPDRYLFTESIIKARDEMKPRETASLYPGVACILGQYYQCPQDPALFTGLYQMKDHMVQPEPKIPADLKASAVYLVMGMYNYETSDGKQKRLRTETLGRIATHYGVSVDPVELDKHLKQRRVLTARISKEGVKLSSVGID